MILAGDVGGTKTILALYRLDGAEWVCHKKEYYLSADFDSFTELLDIFVEREDTLQLQSVCIGVAGPITNGDCITTNLPWVLKRQEIARQTGAKHVVLLNDLEATAWGVVGLPEQDFVELNSKAHTEIGNLAILAAGTGLGEALVVWSDENFHVVATEGGHTDFAPRNELEIGLLQFLMGSYPEHVSCERVVCGQGIVDIYQYLKAINYAAVDKVSEQRMKAEDAAAVISEKANTLTAKAMEMFCEIYGAEAGNLALKVLPRAGVVLAGGIAAKNLESMKDGYFMQGFLAKGRYKKVLEGISVRVCLNAEVALIGAFSTAQKHAEEG